MPIASESGPERPHREEALDLLGAHRRRPGSGSAGRPRDPGTSAWKSGRLSGECRRRTTGSPRCGPGTSAGGASRTPYTIARMRRWSEVAERVAATTKTSEKTAILADVPRPPDARGAAGRGGVPHRPAVPRGGPADDRRRLGGDRGGRPPRRGRRRRRAAAGLRPLVRRRAGGRGRARRRPATRPTGRRRADAARGRATAFAAIEAAPARPRKAELLEASSPGGRRGPPAAIVKVLVGRAPHRAPRGARSRRRSRRRSTGRSTR